MKVFDKYVIREFLRTLGVTVLIFLSVYLIADLFERMDDIIENQPFATIVLNYYIYKIPSMIFNVFPFAMLFAVLLTIRNFIIHNELIAIRSNAITLYRIFKPIVILGILASFLTLGVNELILPFTNQKVHDLGYVLKGKKNPAYKPSKNSIQQLWYRGAGNRFYNMDLLIRSAKEIDKMTIFTLDKNYQLKERLDAEKVLYQNGKWVFFDGVIRIFTGENWVTRDRFVMRVLPLKETFSDFMRVEKKSEEMPFLELKAYLERLKRSGIAPDQYRTYVVDLYSKLSIPAACAVMVLLGIPFALKTGRYKGTAVGVALSIALGFSYWIIYYVGISLGHGGSLPPVIASFAPAVIFGAIGTYSFIHLED